MKKLALLVIVCSLYGCSRQSESEEPRAQPVISTVGKTFVEADSTRSENKYNELQNAYLDLLLKDSTLSNLMKYAESSHISDEACSDNNDEIPICVAIGKQVDSLDLTKNYSAYDVMHRYYENKPVINKNEAVLQEAESLLSKFRSK